MEVNCVPVSASLLPRRFANYHPSVWGHYFLKYSTHTKEIIAHEDFEQLKGLKEEIIQFLINGMPNVSLEKLDLIDAIQRLGIAYHFKSEIKAFLQCLHDTYNDFHTKYRKNLYIVSLSFRILRQGGYYVSCRKYLNEAYWFHNAYVPTMEEYMKVALVSAAYMMLSTTSFVCMDGNISTKEVVEWVVNEPLIVTAASVICRLMDDVASHEFEQERGHVASAVECYMNQHGISKKEAVNEFIKQVENAWRDINKECLICHTAIPMHLLESAANFARVIDAYTHSRTKLKDIITYVLIDPVP